MGEGGERRGPARGCGGALLVARTWVVAGIVHVDVLARRCGSYCQLFSGLSAAVT
jgi:hypothetical protein